MGKLLPVKMSDSERVDMRDVESKSGGEGIRKSTYIIYIYVHRVTDRGKLEDGKYGVSPGGVVVDLRVYGCRDGAV